MSTRMAIGAASPDRPVGHSPRVLIISYHFPPDLAVGAMRPAKTAKYLSRLGWAPCVLTVKEKYLRDKDYERLTDIDGVPVIRTAVWPTLTELAVRLRSGIRRRLRIGRQGNRDATENGGGAPPNRDTGPREPLIGRVKRYVNSLCELPDQYIGWLLPAAWAAYRMIRRERIGVVITSSPPATTALVGLVLSLVTDVRLVTDLRDPWFLPLGGRTNVRSALSDAVQRWLERQIMKRSHRVVTTTEHYRDFLRNLYSGMPKDRFCTVWNGYDEEDFAQLRPGNPGDTFTMSYLGTFYQRRTPRELLRALSELVAEGIIKRSDTKVNFIGEVQYAEGQSVDELIRAFDLEECVTIHPAVSHQEALSRMREADVLLLFAPDQYYCIPAKAFEYIGSGRRVLCLANEGATAELVRRTGAGVVVDPGNIEAIKDVLRELLTEYKRGTRRERVGDVSRYERSVLSRQLSEVLEECLSR